ncbi:MAG: hypothetical protein OEV42_12145 [Deltaproteobacteria bacterium]|nr:hypothetical protein [Deltaproteobacteria bacterium]
MKKYLLLITMIIAVTLPFMLEANDKKGTFADLRNLVFSLNPNDIGLSKESFTYPLWGIVMETGFVEGSFTLVSLADGATSLYFSNGSEKRSEKRVRLDY